MTCWYCGGEADVLTAGEIAERLETSPKLVQRWIYARDLEADRLTVGPGACWRITGDAFWRFLQLDRHRPVARATAGADRAEGTARRRLP